MPIDCSNLYALSGPGRGEVSDEPVNHPVCLSTVDKSSYTDSDTWQNCSVSSTLFSWANTTTLWCWVCAIIKQTINSSNWLGKHGISDEGVCWCQLIYQHHHFRVLWWCLHRDTSQWQFGWLLDRILLGSQKSPEDTKKSGWRPFAALSCIDELCLAVVRVSLAMGV